MTLLPLCKHPEQTLVMGILNVTPDSFSDGGLWKDVSTAISHGHEMIAAGADIIDIGGESTRPGAQPLTPEEEWKRIEPVIWELAQTSTPISVDTYHARTARLAVEAGATIVNDVTGGAGDPDMFATVATTDAIYILQHGRGNARTMDELAHYRDIGVEVAHELSDSLQQAVDSGIDKEKIVLDPGFGFAKKGDDNWELAARIDEIQGLGLPLLVGVSRKGSLKEVSNAPGPMGRDDATTAFTTYFAEHGVWGVRVHNVPASVSAVKTVAKLRQAGAHFAPGVSGE